MIDDALADLSGAVHADGATFGAAMEAVYRQAQAGDPSARDLALAHLAGLFGGLPSGRGSRLAVLCGALVERGADPLAALGPVVEGFLAAADAAHDFVVLWRGAVRLEPPEPTDDPQTFEAVVDRLGSPDGVPPEDVRRCAAAWFTLGQWAMALTTFLQRGPARAALPRRDDVVDAVDALKEARYDLDWLVDLLRVLDDERLVVLHRASGLGWEMTISGVGDNFQLHTLLAATLVRAGEDGFLAGPRPTAAEVAAAADGPLRPDGGLRGYFHLVDGEGHWIWNEGVPADIPVVGGHRVVVLDPLPEPRTWDAGRPFAQMVPRLRLDRVLPADEALLLLAAVPSISTPTAP